MNGKIVSVYLRCLYLAVAVPMIMLGIMLASSALVAQYHQGDVSVAVFSMLQVLLMFVTVLLVFSLFANALSCDRLIIFAFLVGLMLCAVTLFMQGFPPYVLGTNQGVMFIFLTYLVSLGLAFRARKSE